MKNMNKKIIALAMIIGFANISAEIIKFAPNELSQKNSTWDTETNVVITPSNTITYFDIKKINGYTNKLEIPEGYKLIGTYNR